MPAPVFMLKLPSSGWQVAIERQFSFHLWSKEMVQRGKNLGWGRFHQVRNATPNGWAVEPGGQGWPCS